MRSKNDCVFSTSKSINFDNSLLNCRIEGLNNHVPDLFIIDLNLRLRKNLLLNKILDKRKTFLITTKENKNRSILFKKKGFKIIFIKSLKTKNDFTSLFQQIYQLGYCRVFFETGLSFLNSLLNHKVLNNLYVLQNDRMLRKKGSNNDTMKYLKKFKLKNKINVNLKDDSLYKVEL